MRYEDYNGVIYGKRGKRNQITDVEGVLVGQVTVKDERHNTGVTVIIPAAGNLFTDKCIAAGYVHNGFGKTAGLIQVEELGTIETPIALTNTLNVGLVSDAIVEESIRRCEQDGVELQSVNPVVGECNDSRFNEITKRVIGYEQVHEAILSAGTEVEEGAVGAGCGTTCYGFKGGIGTASRVIKIDGKEYTVGVLVQSNFGAAKQLLWKGEQVGKWYLDHKKETDSALYGECDKGSIMSILATDLPVTSRQLKRIIRRMGAGLARTGSSMGHGSGEIMIGFTTANRVSMNEENIVNMSRLKESALDEIFKLTADAEMEAVYNSMLQADSMVSLKGDRIMSLRDVINIYEKNK